MLVGRGGDNLTGGGGHDTFVFNKNFGLEKVTDFNAASDVISVDHTMFSSFTDIMLHAVQSGTSTVITYDGADVITLQNIEPQFTHPERLPVLLIPVGRRRACAAVRSRRRPRSARRSSADRPPR